MRGHPQGRDRAHTISVCEGTRKGMCVGDREGTRKGMPLLYTKYMNVPMKSFKRVVHNKDLHGWRNVKYYIGGFPKFGYTSR